MNKAIPIEWIDKHLEWLDNCDNELAQLATIGIREMVKVWQSEQMLDKLKGQTMSEYRLFKVIRTDGQKYYSIEYVRDVVTCGECIHCADDYIDVGMGTMPQFTCELGRCGESVQPNDFCSYGEREGE